MNKRALGFALTGVTVVAAVGVGIAVSSGASTPDSARGTATATKTCPAPVVKKYANGDQVYSATCTIHPATVTVTATPSTGSSPSSSSSSSSSPSVSPSTSSSPSATPTTTTPTTGFPDSTNTGVPAGTALTTYSGPCQLAAGTVLDKVSINCAATAVQAMGPGVKITNSRIIGRILSDHSNGGSQATSSISISDSYIDGGQQETFPAVAYDSVTLTRVEIVGGQHSVQCNSGCNVYDSYLHAQYLPQGSAGHVNAFISNGGAHMVLRHNTLWCSVDQNSTDGGCSGDASLFGDFDPNSYVTFDNNFFHQTHGSYCLFGGERSPGSSKPYDADHITITNNVFQRGTAYAGNGGIHQCGFYGAATSIDPGRNSTYVVSGNVFDDGTAIRTDQ